MEEPLALNGETALISPYEETCKEAKGNFLSSALLNKLVSGDLFHSFSHFSVPTFIFSFRKKKLLSVVTNESETAQSEHSGTVNNEPNLALVPLIYC